MGEIRLHTKSNFNRLLLREEKIFFNLYFHSSYFARRFDLPVEIIGVKMGYHIFVNGVLSIEETEAHFGQNRPKSTIIGYVLTPSDMDTKKIPPFWTGCPCRMREN